MSGWKQHDLRWIELPQAGSMLLRRMNAFAFQSLDQRDRHMKLLRTTADWQLRREQGRRRDRPVHCRLVLPLTRDSAVILLHR